MATINKSIVLTALVPAARHDEAVFLKAVDRLASLGVNTIEYASPLNTAVRRGQLLSQRGLEGIFLAATFQKEGQQNLASISGETRAHAVAACKEHVDAAIASGAKGVLITSGRYPDDPAKASDAWQAFEESLHALLNVTRGHIRLLLEPGDRTVDSMQLAGPSDEVLALVQRMNQPLSDFALTMDISHIAQLGESLYPALEKTAPFCDHVHLANCVLTPGDPLFGDKHPLFTHHGAHYHHQEIRDAATYLKEHTVHNRLTLALEVISREKDPFHVMERVIEEESWFFSKK
ncbi:MAG: sugar phosphate isomerase/epimerase family protein [Christensenellales bacterium]|jgi:sugar phosphate isomerase/epimerase